MISVDDLIKIVLVLSVSFAVVGISFQLMRLFSKLVDVLEDARKILGNFNELSDYALEDYLDARGFIKETISDLKNLQKFIKNPILIAGRFVEFFEKVKRQRRGSE